MAFIIVGCFQVLALTGQTLTQAEHEVHNLGSVITVVSIVIAFVGHTSAHLPHLVHSSSSVEGKTSLAFSLISLYERVPEVMKGKGWLTREGVRWLIENKLSWSGNKRMMLIEGQARAD